MVNKQSLEQEISVVTQIIMNCRTHDETLKWFNVLQNLQEKLNKVEPNIVIRTHKNKDFEEFIEWLVPT